MESIQEKSMVSEFKQSFIDYAMSVILDRALPDVRDGLKPVHRRILFAMYEAGMTPDKPYRKSARVVGDVLAKYHPHGDSSVYEALVRMAQPWNLRSMLIDMHGNNGSIDGDGAAAMRYTESRLQKLSMEFMEGIDKETVDFKENYDGNEMEPVLLPARFPNLLVNGASGIAVGMASGIAPHNLKEACKAVIAQIDNPDITVDELMEIMPGPDFPTGGLIMGQEGIRSAYETGKGSIVVRGVAKIEVKKNKNHIVITEIPYQVKREEFVEKMMELQTEWDQYQRELKKEKRKVVKEKGYDFALDIRNESDRNNPVRIVIDVKPGKNPMTVLNELYKRTKLQSSFSYNANALTPKEDGTVEPNQLSLLEMNRYYIDYQVEVLTREYTYVLKKQKARVHLLDAIIKALKMIDNVISTIRSSETTEEARKKLMELLTIDKDQAQAILDMRLTRLTNLEQDKVLNERDGLGKSIAILEDKLGHKNLILEDVKESLRKIIGKYGDDRRTQIMPPAEKYNEEDYIEEEDVVITMTHKGYIKRTPESLYSSQRRNGRGVNGMLTYEDDFVEQLQIVNSKDYLLFFTNLGKVYQLKAHQIPEFKKDGRGISIRNILELNTDEIVKAMISVREYSEQQYLLFATEKGNVKKTQLSKYCNIYKTGIAAISLKEGDNIVNASLTDGEQWITLITKNGKAIKFHEKEVKSVGRIATGVKGIVLDAKKQDQVIACVINDGEADILTVTSKGFGKRTSVSDIREQSRNGKGVIVHKVNSKTGEVVGTEMVQTNDALMLVTKKAKNIKLLVDNISKFGRNTQGTKIFNLYEGDEVQSVARISDHEEEINLE